MAASTRLRLARVLALTCSLGVAGWMVLRAQGGGPAPASPDPAGAVPQGPGDPGEERPSQTGEFLSTSKALAPMDPALLEERTRGLPAEPGDATFLSTSKSLQPVFLPSSKSALPPTAGPLLRPGDVPVVDPGETGTTGQPPAPKSTPKGSGQ